MRTYKCIVPGCNSNNRDNPNFSFFSLPQTPGVLENWVTNLHLAAFIREKSKCAIDQYRVCERHFQDSSFQNPLKKKLNRGAVPYVHDVPEFEIQDPPCISQNSGIIDLPESENAGDEAVGRSVEPVFQDFMDNPASTLPEETLSSQIPIKEFGPTLPATFSDTLQSPTKILETAVPGTSIARVSTSHSSKIPSEEFAEGRFVSSISMETPSTSRSVTEKRRPYGVLKEFGIENKQELTPRKRKMYGEYIKIRKILRTIEKKGTANPRKLFTEDIGEVNFVKSLQKMNPIQQTFLKSVVRNHCKKPAARRFSNEEKAFYVVLYKNSPRGYRSLAKILPMPTPRTLNRSLSNISLEPGINNKLFGYLNRKSEMHPIDRYCLLMFDEVSLRPHLSYNKGSDEVEGLEAITEERSYKLADHALVFMIRGLHKSWKQPIAFYFVQATAKSCVLKTRITQVVQAIHEQTKFVVVASVSDLGSSNRTAVRSLSSEYGRPDEYIYNVNGSEIIHVFDPPHLIKCMRNNFLTKNIIFDGKVAKWSDLKTLYDLDGNMADSKITKLTSVHIAPEGKQKMKVKFAVQVFSRSVYAALTFLSKTGALSADATAEFCMLMNNLFDSFNSTLIAPRPLSCRVHDKSAHHEFWAEAKIMLGKLSFVGEHQKAVPVPPCVKFFLVSIRNIQTLWSALKKLGFRYLLTKSVNQDPLENFFGVVRGLCGQNDNPSCSQFVSAFKTCIINNTVKNSAGSNCEDDGGSYLLALNSLLTPSSVPFQTTSSSIDPPFLHPSSRPTESLNKDMYELTQRLRTNTTAYISGFIGRKVLPHGCQRCVEFFTTTTCTDSHAVIQLRDYGTQKKKLLYPQEGIISEIERIRKIIFEKIPENLNKQKIIKILSLMGKEEWKLEFPCPDHNNIVIEKINICIAHTMLKYFLNMLNKKIHNKEKRANNVIDNYIRTYCRFKID